MTLLLILAFAYNAPELDGDGFDDLVDCDDSDADIFPDADADGFGDLADQTAPNDRSVCLRLPDTWQSPETAMTPRP